MISEQRIIELGWEHSNEFDDEVKFSKDGLFAFANALQAEWIKSIGEPVAQAYINVDGECEQIDWLGTIKTKVDDEFTALYALPNEEVK